MDSVTSLTLPASWATTEAPTVLRFEKLVNAAIGIGCVAYGVHVAIFAACTYHLINGKKPFSWYYQMYITVLFILSSTNIACNIRFNELTWIDERNFPGGPGAFIFAEQAVPADTIGDAAANLVTLMVDALLIYRCYVVWGSQILVVVLPILMLIASTVMSVMRTIAAAQPASSLFAQNAVRFGLPYWILSMSLNVLVTIIIVTRLWTARRNLRSLGVDEGHLTTYTGLSAMLIESALPYGVTSLILIVVFSKGSVTGEVLLTPLPIHVQCIAPELILIRVWRGTAWSKTTMSAPPSVTPIHFASSRGTGASVVEAGGSEDAVSQVRT